MTLVYFNRKAQAFVWIAILAVILVMGLFYTMLSEPMSIMRNKFGGDFADSMYEDPYKKITTIWDNFLIVFLLAVLAFGILISMRRNPYE